ncbi:MAG TPA: metal ABC transporter ATP-binding protein [Herpetosiphonaceae bacterium]|nr:metal ABC transporter ATP-binding protein [Herpetosiphonaceae bacterium]
MEPLIELNAVSFGYGDTPVLEDICLHLHPGQFAALVGPSGAGKTTLLKLILGTLAPVRGEVRVDGRVLQAGARPRVGYVPQLETVDWNFPVTVEQVVLMGRVRRSGIWPWPRAEDRRRVHGVLERLGIAGVAGQHIRNLSGGQQQRVFLARALIAEPDLLVLDEPTTGVDMRTAENVLHLIGELNCQGMTILMTTHDLNAAAAHVPWVVCLNRRIVAQGPPDLIFTPETLNATYQGDMLVLRQDGMLFVQQRPHGHTYRDLVPHPVAGEVPVPMEEVRNGRPAPTIPV